MLRKNKVEIKWSPKFAYVIGLIATDGNLSKDGRHINFTSKDLDLVEIFKNHLNLDNKITKKTRAKEDIKKYYQIQFGDINFYEFLLSIGLTPHKSKTINNLCIPGKYFMDFFRGCIDGDGSIGAFMHPDSKNPQLRLRLCSASKKFLLWTMAQNKIYGVKGYIRNANRVYILEYAMADSINLLNKIYYKGFPLSLNRKFLFAKKYLAGMAKQQTH